MKKVSIVIPVYNGSNYVSKAIDSALAQTYKNIEIIVVNDGSNDGGKTAKICKKYGKKIIYYEKKNGGVSSALNLAISKMSGDYFSWLSHDDIYLPDKIKKQVEEISKYDEKTIVYSNFDLINELGQVTLHVYRDHDSAVSKPAYAVLHGYISGITLLIPRKAFDVAGFFNEEHRCVQDYELWFDMIMKGYNFVHMIDILAQSRVHSKQQSNYSSTMASEGSWLWNYMLSKFPTKKKVEYEGSEYLFNIKMLEYLKYTPYDEAISQLKIQTEKILFDTKEKIKKNKITVVIDNVDSEENLQNTLFSLEKQKFEKVDIIIVTNNILSEKFNKYNMIQKNELKKYLKKIKTNYINFLSSGSKMNESWLENQIINLNMSKKGYIYSDIMNAPNNSFVDNYSIIPSISLDTVVLNYDCFIEFDSNDYFELIYKINQKYGSIGINTKYFETLSKNPASVHVMINSLKFQLNDDKYNLKDIATIAYDIAVLYNKEEKNNKRIEMYYPCKQLEELNYSRSFKFFLKYLEFKKKLKTKLRK